MSRFLSYVRRHHIALLALFVAMGGTSYAAFKLPNNSVGSKQIKNGAVGSSEVRDRSLLATDFRTGQLPAGAQGVKGETGAPGQPGTAGQDGAAGHDGLNGAAVVARLRSSAPRVMPGGGIGGSNAPIPLNPASWTQGATDVDLLEGTLTYTGPASCDPPGLTGIFVALDGSQIGSATVNPTSGTHTVPITFTQSLFEPGAATARTLTVTPNNGCNNSGQNVTIESVRIDAIAAR